MKTNPPSGYSPAAVLVGAALGLISGFAIFALKFRAPKPPKGG